MYFTCALVVAAQKGSQKTLECQVGCSHEDLDVRVKGM